MSQDSAKLFLAKMKQDKELADKMHNATTKDTRWAIIEQEGFEFSREELDHATVTELNHFERWSWEAKLLADWL